MRTLLLLVCCISITIYGHTQLCQGSLGDPVVKITFGAGPNPGPILLSSGTSYQYLSADCPNDGYYAVRNSTDGCFSDTWINIEHDHTGDPNGYFMLVNATYEPGDFYVNTVTGLCPGSTYEFSAWIVNILRNFACGGQGIMPDITFKITTTAGEQLGIYNTGKIPSTGEANWTQYGMFFTTPPNVNSVIIRMTNNAPGGCGNDIAMDDITFRPCGPTMDVSIAGLASDTANTCDKQGNVFTFNARVSPGFNDPVFQWQTSIDGGVTWSDIINSTATQYTKPQTDAVQPYYYRVSAAEKGNIDNSACRINSNAVVVNVNPLPQVNVSSYYSLCTNDTLMFSATGGNNYNWTGPNNFSSQDSLILIPNPTLNYSGTYYVQTLSDKGCAYDDTIVVKIHTAPVANAGNDATICEGNSVQLTATGGVNYSWSPPTGLSSANIFNPLAAPTDSTLYMLTVTDANNCVVRDSVAVNVWKKPFANAGPDKKILEGQSVQLNGAVAGTNITFAWQPFYNINDESTVQPVVSPAHDTTYTLAVTSLFGCGTAADNVFVRVLETVHVPNAFSPNGDGINDTWNIEKLITYPEADLYVYNRYGQPVFHSKGYYRPWDGTFKGSRLPFGTYYYVIDLKNNLARLSGWVLIVY